MEIRKNRAMVDESPDDPGKWPEDVENQVIHGVKVIFGHEDNWTKYKFESEKSRDDSLAVILFNLKTIEDDFISIRGDVYRKGAISAIYKTSEAPRIRTTVPRG